MIDYAPPSQLDQDREYWDVLAKLLNWRLRAFKGRETAAYFTGSPGYHVLHMWASERDRIVSTILARREGPGDVTGVPV